MAGRTYNVMVRLTPDVGGRLEKRAEVEGKSRAQLVREVVERYLDPPADLTKTTTRLEMLMQRMDADAGEAQELVDRLLDRHTLAPMAEPSASSPLETA